MKLISTNNVITVLVFSLVFVAVLWCNAESRSIPEGDGVVCSKTNELYLFSDEIFRSLQENEQILAAAVRTLFSKSTTSEGKLDASWPSEGVLEAQLKSREIIKTIKKPYYFIEHSGDIYWWEKELNVNPALPSDTRGAKLELIKQLASSERRKNQQFLVMRSVLFCDCRIAIAKKKRAEVLECLENYFRVMKKISLCSGESCSNLCKLIGEFLQLVKLGYDDLSTEERERTKDIFFEINDSILPDLTRKSIFFAKNTLIGNMPLYALFHENKNTYEFAEKTLEELEELIKSDRYFNLDEGPIFGYAETELNQLSGLIVKEPDNPMLHIELQKIRVIRERDFCSLYFVRIKARLDDATFTCTPAQQQTDAQKTEE